MSEKKSAAKKSPQSEEPMVFLLNADAKSPLKLSEEADFTAQTSPPSQMLPQSPSGWVGTIIFGIVSTLLSLFIVEAIWQLVDELSARSALLGQITLGLALLLGVTAFFFVIKVILSLFHLQRVTALRLEAAEAIADPKLERVDRFARHLIAFYAQDPASAAGRAKCADMLNDVHDPVILLRVLERALLEDKDNAARDAIATAAQRVSLVTALSPRAVINLIFVLGQTLMLIRTLSGIYGARASGVGLLRLAGRVTTHLMVTGGMAAADTLLSEVVGTGVAARLSARLGEGVVNGILTARVGIATVELVRPMPFVECEGILLSKVVKSLVFRKSVAENAAY